MQIAWCKLQKTLMGEADDEADQQYQILQARLARTGGASRSDCLA